LTAGKAERQILKILVGTARIFDQQGCWTRYYLARDKDDKEVAIGAAEATKFCLTGAVWKSQLNLKGSDGARHGAIRFLNYVCRATYGKGLEKHGTPQDIQEFAWFPASYVNDTLLNNIGEVRNILRSATKALQKHIQQTEKVDATVAVPPPPKPRPKPAPAPATADEAAPDDEALDDEGLMIQVVPKDRQPGEAAESEAQEQEEEKLAFDLPEIEVDLELELDDSDPKE